MPTLSPPDSYTFEQARDFIYQTFFSYWTDPTNGIASIPGVTFADVIWDDEEPADDTPITSVEAYVTVRHVDGQQASLRGENGRRWKRTGICTVRMRFPPGLQLKTTDAVSKVANDAFQGKRGVGDGFGIWFHKVRLVEFGRNQARYRADVLAYFEYDEIS